MTSPPSRFDMQLLVSVIFALYYSDDQGDYHRPAFRSQAIKACMQMSPKWQLFSMNYESY